MTLKVAAEGITFDFGFRLQIGLSLTGLPSTLTGLLSAHLFEQI